MSKKRVGIVALGIGAMWVATSCQVTINDLGGATSVAYGVNASGVIVGESELPTSSPSVSDSHAFKRLADDTVVDLGTLPGDVWSRAEDINDAGTIVGTSGTSGLTTTQRRAVTWSSTGQIAALPSPGWGNTSAQDINAGGIVVGTGELGPAWSRAFVYDPAVGAITPLPLLPGATKSAASGLNDNGQVVGSVWDGETDSRTVRWDLTAGTVTDITWTGLHSAEDINNAGTVVGRMQNVNPAYEKSRPGIWFPGTGAAIGLTTVPGYPRAIDESGTVVGVELNGGSSFRWTSAGGYVVIAGLDTPSAANDLGPAGSIVGHFDRQATVFYP